MNLSTTDWIIIVTTFLITLGMGVHSARRAGSGETFTRAMAKELGPSNIRVNSLCPGMISTLFHDTFTKDTVAYLASDESSFLTGVNLDINGGLYYS